MNKPNLKKASDDVIKVDLSAKPEEDDKPEEKVEDANKEQETTDMATDQQAGAVQEVVEEVPQGKETVQDDESILEEITTEEVSEEPTEDLKELVEEVEEAQAEAEATGKPLPENIQKLVDFMEETGGTIEDYVELNRDIDSLDNMTVLQEYGIALYNMAVDCKK